MNILKIFTKNRQIGDLGEVEAIKLLQRKGYRILEKNYTARGAEIDIIARKMNITAFVEVKARNVKHLGHYEARPASAVTPEKQRKIIKAANHYSQRKVKDSRLRFDVVEVYLEDYDKGIRVKEVKHLEGAFDLNTAYSGYRPKNN